ncbi:reticulocyte binding protein 2b (RBP2b) [Plasmodium malariae]|uniref:Reticulocyte binding protein 2b (RBP2b) n=1 Tax=Plasmodium malariae TaxID=5858 RepID=A0A1A8WJ07_PLAMA|nr:reticulocyte binding protein 2b (RBP2b) [Plasmodium malariae]
MEKNILWVIIYNILFILFVSSKEKNRKISSKLKDRLTLLPLQSNIKEKTEFAYNNKEENLKSINYSNEKENNKNSYNEINVDSLQKPYLRNNASLVTLKNYISTKTPLYYAQTEKNNLYTRGRVDNETVRVNDNLSTVLNSFVQNKSTNTDAYDTLDYIDFTDERGNIFSTLYPYYSLMYYFYEIKNFTWIYPKIYFKYEDMVNKRVNSLFKEIQRTVNNCKSQKEYLIKLYNTLLNPRKEKLVINTYALKHNEFQRKLDSYRKCFSDKSKHIMNQIINIKSDTFILLSNINCNKYCEASTYKEVCEQYIEKSKKIPYDSYRNYIINLKNHLDSCTDILSKIEKELGQNVFISATKFLLDDMKLISSRYSDHLENYITALTSIKAYANDKKQKHMSVNTIINYYNFLSNYLADFRFSIEHIRRMETTLKNKEKLIFHDFSSYLTNLKGMARGILDYESFPSDINSKVSDSEKILKFGEDVYTNITEVAKNLSTETNTEFIKVKANYDEIRVQQAAALEELRPLVASIKETYITNTSKKNEIDTIIKKNVTPSNFLQRATELINLIALIKTSRPIMQNNFKLIEENYKKVIHMKTKIEELAKQIQIHEKEMVIIKEKETHINSIKMEIKNKLEYITENIDKIKKIISKKEDTYENIAQIEELINEAQLNVVQFTNEKNEIQKKIDSIITNFFNGNKEEFVDTSSKLVEELKNVTYEGGNVDDIDKLLEKTTEVHNGISKMKCDQATQILNNLDKESNDILTLKNNIIGNRFQSIYDEISNTFDQIRDKHGHLKKSMEGYKEDKKKLKQYKVNIINRKNEFLNELHENDKDVSVGQNTYKEFLEYKNTILNKGSKIFSEINILKDIVQATKHKLVSYDIILKKFKNPNMKTYIDIDNLLNDYNNENIDLKLSEYEKEHNSEEQEVNKIIYEIEISNKYIDIIKTLNIAINHLDTNDKLVDGLIKNKNYLNEKLDMQIQAMKNINLIQQNDKTKFELSLNREKNDIKDKLADGSINNLKNSIHDISTLSKKLKEHIRKNGNITLETLDEKIMNWNHINVKIDNLNTNYQAINKKIDDLIREQNSEIIILSDKFITEKNKEINEKIEKNKKSLKQMKTTLSAFDFKTYIKKDTNNIIKEKINTFKKNTEALMGSIDNKVAQLNDLERKSSKYIEKSNVLKSKDMQFKEKISDMGKIYEEMESTYKELKIEEVKSELGKVDHTTLEYERILIYDIIQQIRDENADAKQVMKVIESSNEQIITIEHNTHDGDQKYVNDMDYNVHYQKSKTSNSKIDQIVVSAENELNIANENNNVNQIKEIKKKVNDYMQDLRKEKNTMQEALKEIKNAINLISLNNSNAVIDSISKNTEDAKEYNEQAKTEFEKANTLIQEVKTLIDKAKIYKNDIKISLDNEQIDTNVNEIKNIKEQIENKKKDINAFLNKGDEYKEKIMSKISKANTAKKKIEFLQEKGHHVDTKNVDDNIGQCVKYLEEVTSNEKNAKQNYKSFLKYEEDITTISRESLILGIKTKSEKMKNEATQIMNYIKIEHGKIKEKLGSFQEKLKKLNEKQNITQIEDPFNNKKSSNANVIIQYNLGRVEQNLSNVNIIEKEIGSILTSANDSLSVISKITATIGENTLENAKKEESIYTEQFNKMKDTKELMLYKQRKMDEIDSNIVNIEIELEKQKKIYEIGILEKIKEIADKVKLYMDTTKELLNSSMKTFISFFKGKDLKEYNFEENLEEYKSRIYKIYDEFDASYKIIEDNVKNTSDNSKNYNEVKRLREEAQNEQTKLRNKEDEAKKYLNDIKKKESFRLIHHIKEEVQKINEICTHEYSEVNKIHEAIKLLAEDIKKLDDQNSILDIIKQAVDKNRSLQDEIHNSYKNKAKNMFSHIVLSANFIDAKIAEGLLSLERSAEERSITTSELKLESTIAIKLETENEEGNKKEFDVYNDIRDAHKNLLQIIKYSEVIDSKQKENEKLIKNLSDMNLNIKSMIALYNKINNTKSKKKLVLSKIDDIFNKYNTLDKIKFNNEGYNHILDESKYEKLKQLSESYNQKKISTVDESELNKLKVSFDNYIVSLDKLEIKVQKINVKENVGEIIQKEKLSLDEIYKNIEEIEKIITKSNTSFDELLKQGKENTVFMYKSIKENLSMKIENDLLTINKKQHETEKFLSYVKNNHSFMMNYIASLDAYFDTKSIGNDTSTNVEQATKFYTELVTAVKESKEIIHDIKKEFEYNEETEINILQNSLEKLKNLYNKLTDKKIIINEVNKKINDGKLQEIKTVHYKYNDLAKLFNNEIETQKTKLLKNKNNIQDIRTIIINKEKELALADEKFTLQSANKFNEIYEDINTNIKKLQELEKINDSEDKKLKIYVNKISHLINSAKSLLNYANEYEKSHTIEKESVDIENVDRMDLTKTKQGIHNLEKDLNKILKNIQENEKLYNNNETNKFTSEILKNIDIMRENFSNNLPQKQKLIEIENNFSDINGIFNEIKNDYKEEKFIENMSKNIQSEIESTKGKTNEEEIKNIIKKITNYNEETKNELHITEGVLDRIDKKKILINELFDTFSINSNVDIYNSAKKCITESDKIIEELQSYINKMTDLINNTNREVEYIEDKLKTLNKPIPEILSPYRQNLLTKIHEHTQHAKENSKHEKSNDQSNSRTKGANENIRFAGGIILGFSICSGVALAAFMNKEKTEEECFNVDDEGFENNGSLNLQDKEEVIEVCFNEDDYA